MTRLCSLAPDSGVDVSMDTAGVAVTLIDFTLSRLDTGAGTVAFCDLSADPDLFKGPKNDCQASNSLLLDAAGRAATHTPEPPAVQRRRRYLHSVTLRPCTYTASLDVKTLLSKHEFGSGQTAHVMCMGRACMEGSAAHLRLITIFETVLLAGEYVPAHEEVDRWPLGGASASNERAVAALPGRHSAQQEDNRHEPVREEAAA